MADNSGSVTLIFYRVGAKWWREPALNLLAAAAQRSAYTHVELAIGEDALDDGSMTNVVRIFVRRALTSPHLPTHSMLHVPTVSNPSFPLVCRTTRSAR